MPPAARGAVQRARVSMGTAVLPALQGHFIAETASSMESGSFEGLLPARLQASAAGLACAVAGSTYKRVDAPRPHIHFARCTYSCRSVGADK